MKRLVWAWPVGLVGNVLLFTVFASGELQRPVAEPLWGQAGRQVFFAAVALYGWWRWSQLAARRRRRRRRRDHPALGDLAPSAASCSPLGVVGYAVAFVAAARDRRPGARATEAWIFAGSMLATYGMARGLGGVLARLDRSSTSSA